LFVFTQNDPGFPLTCIQTVTGLVCVCVNTDAVMMLHSDWCQQEFIQADEKSCQKSQVWTHSDAGSFHTPLMPLRQSFRCPTSSSQTHVCTDHHQFIFSKASSSSDYWL